MKELRQSPKFDIFQEVLFCTLASSINLILKAVPIKTGHIYVNILVFLVNTGHFLIFCAFLKKLKLKEKISNNPFDFSIF